MGEATTISWTDHTFNPWWGCARVSPGCQHCYAETFAKRTGHDVWGQGGRRRFGDRHWNEPLRWNDAAEEAGRPALVFCASMADVFEDRADHEPDRERLWNLIRDTPWLEWQLLTKRPENVLGMVPPTWADGLWPLHVWIGCTVEDQQRASQRIPHLLDIPAAVRFLSCEPLLGPVSLSAWTHPSSHLTDGWWHDGCPACLLRRAKGGRTSIDWVILGGESGPGHRPLDLDHARSVRDQCAAAGVPFFFKQVGGHHPTTGGDLLDGRQHKAFPARTAR